ncbi:MAG: histidine kinase [Myxococcota bacterium]
MNRAKRLGLGFLFTLVVLSILTTLTRPATFGVLTFVGLGLWIGTVLTALTLVGAYAETRVRRPWALLLLLALTAGLASAAISTVIYAVVAALPAALPEGPEAWTGFASPAEAALIGFFDGDALFGFWALWIELPQRFAQQAELAKQRNEWRHEAEITRIRRGLEPHFLLNTLNTISATVVSQPQQARELLGVLGDLLRDLLEGADEPYQRVRDQVAWLQGLSQILQSRHEGRLKIHWDIDARVRDALLPALVLQPLLENAVSHGALRHKEGGEVAVRITPEGESIRCVVEDDGPGFQGEPFGHGLSLVERRINLEKGSLDIDSSSTRTRVTVILPRRTA